jgi:hypothetical protein
MEVGLCDCKREAGDAIRSIESIRESMERRGKGCDAEACFAVRDFWKEFDCCITKSQVAFVLFDNPDSRLLDRAFKEAALTPLSGHRGGIRIQHGVAEKPAGVEELKSDDRPLRCELDYVRALEVARLERDDAEERAKRSAAASGAGLAAVTSNRAC